MIHLALLSLLVTLAGPALAQSPEELFLKGFYLESAERDFDGASESYRRAAALAPENASLHSRALTGQARCALALGRYDEARALFERALRIDPGNAEARRGLDQERPDPAEELGRRIDGLIEKLGTAERETAVKDLKLIGEVAIPKLEAALASTEAGRVAGAVAVLASLRKPGFDALARSLASGAAPFPRALSARLPAAGSDHPTASVALAEAASRHEDAVVREAARQWMNLARGRSKVPEEVFVRLHARLLRDPDPALRLAAVQMNAPSPLKTREILDLVVTNALSDDLELRAAALVWIASDLRSDQVPHPDAETQARLHATCLDLLGSGDATVREATPATGCLFGSTVDWKPGTSRAYAALLRRCLPPDPGIGDRGAAYLLVDQAMQSLAPRVTLQRLTAEDAWSLLLTPLPLPDDADQLRTAWSRLRSAIVGEARRRLGPAPLAALLEKTWNDQQDPEIRRLVLAAMEQERQLPPAVLVEAARSEQEALRAVAYQGLVALGEEEARARGILLPFAEEDLSQRSLYTRRNLLTLLGWQQGIDLERMPSAEPLDAGRLPTLEALQSVLAVSNLGRGPTRIALRLAARTRGREAVPLLDAAIRSNAIGRAGDSTIVREAARLARVVLGDAAVPFLVDVETRIAPVGLGPLALPNTSADWTETDRSFLERWFRELPDPLVTAACLDDAVPLGPEFEREVLRRALGLAARPRTSNSLVKATVQRITSREDRSLLPGVVALLDHPEANVRQIVREALEELQRTRALRSAFDPVSRERRDKAVADATRLLKADDPTARQGGALALAALGATEAVPEILGLLADPEPAVRRAALKALERMGASED